MKLSSIQFCWWQSRWYFPTFFRLTLKPSRCPFYYSSKWSWLEICLGSLNSNPVPSKAGLKALQHIFSEHYNISQSKLLPEVDRSHLRCHLQLCNTSCNPSLSTTHFSLSQCEPVPQALHPKPLPSGEQVHFLQPSSLNSLFGSQTRFGTGDWQPTHLDPLPSGKHLQFAVAQPGTPFFCSACFY